MPTTIPLGINKRTNEPFTVMIVDDTISIRILLKRLLIRKEFRVISEAQNGQIALDELELLNIKPDIIFIDQEMPEMDGLSAIQEIRPKYPNIKIIMFTSHAEKPLVQEILNLKVNAYIVKPFEEHKVIEKLAHLLGRKELIEKEIVVYKTSQINLKDIEIPALPDVVNKIMMVDINDPESSGKELEKIVSPDISISTNLIRIANSSYYGRSGKIRNLKDAITLLGVKMVKNIILLEANKKLHKGLDAPLFKKYLRELPTLSAIVSIDLSKNPANVVHLREEIFLASLLRKVGMLIFALNYKEQYLHVLKLYEFGLKSLYEIEKEEFNLNSIQMATKVFESWKMPEFVLKVISNQNFSQSEIPIVSDLDRVTRLSEIIAQKLLGMSHIAKEDDIANAIFDHYKASDETKSLFGEDYYDIIKDHPFLEIALG
ncbi:MAG: HDOD domain-containing protein [Leptospiraceae bacterium]|nr:HDOD domain-containing protein [Leptospiraceae bacterium]MCP5493866.1 HDOD domain-containing protein [Leptospiraceae bacterium]